MIKPRKMWAVISPNGELLAVNPEPAEVLFEAVKKGALDPLYWRTLMTQPEVNGYKLTKVRVTAEEV